MPAVVLLISLNNLSGSESPDSACAIYVCQLQSPFPLAGCAVFVICCNLFVALNVESNGERRSFFLLFFSDVFFVFSLSCLQGTIRICEKSGDSYKYSQHGTSMQPLYSQHSIVTSDFLER